MKRGADSSPNGLLFPWNDKPASFWRLLPYLGFCLIVLAGFFILFKISYPVSDPAPRFAQGVIMLDPNQPAHQSVLNRAYDRSALFLKTEPAMEAEHEAALLPLFRPSFQGYEMRLKETVQQESVATAHRLFQPEDLALPKISPFARMATPIKKSAPPRKFTLQVRLSGHLADRPLLTPPDLSGITPQDLPRLRFHLAVNPLGRVILALPISASTEDRPLIPALQSALAQVRFAPLPGAENQVELVTFEWQPLPRRD